MHGVVSSPISKRNFLGSYKPGCTELPCLPAIAETGCLAEPTPRAAGSTSPANGEFPWTPRRGTPPAEHQCRYRRIRVERGLYVGRAYEVRRGAVLATRPPQLFAFGEGNLQPAEAAGNGAFDRNFSGHFRKITTTGQAVRASGQSNRPHTLLSARSTAQTLAHRGRIPAEGETHAGWKLPHPVADRVVG